jgi:hypothetical protein
MGLQASARSAVGASVQPAGILRESVLLSRASWCQFDLPCHPLPVPNCGDTDEARTADEILVRPFLSIIGCRYTKPKETSAARAVCGSGEWSWRSGSSWRRGRSRLLRLQRAARGHIW